MVQNDLKKAVSRIERITSGNTPRPVPIHIDMEELEREAEANREKYNQELRAKAKKEEDLIIPVEFTARKVYGHTSAERSYLRESDEGIYTLYGTGRSELEVLVKGPAPFEKIIFPAIIPLEDGDRFRAYLFKGKREYEHGEVPLELAGSAYPMPASYFIERAFTSTEYALKIEKLKNKKVAATYEVNISR